MNKVFALVLILLVFACTVHAGEPSKNIEVYKYTGAVQCQAGSGISLEAMANQLKNARVNVIAMKTGSDGRMYATVCGGKSGRINIYTISANDLTKALDLGFLQKTK